MDRPILSIIIPVYNASSSIGKITKTILGQSFSDFELILVDDGSTDDSLKKMKELAKQDRRIFVYSKANGGPSSARNYGLSKARGQFIQFYDADDNILSGAINAPIKTMLSLKADLVVSGWRIDNQRYRTKTAMSPKRHELRGDNTAYVLRSIGSDGTLYNLWNKLFRADIIKKHSVSFREDVRFGEDLIFALHYFRLIDHLVIIPDVTYSYRISGSTSEFRRSAIIPEYRHINDDELRRFLGNHPSQEVSDLFNWVRWRWLISYWALVSDAKLPIKKKLSLIRQNLNHKITIANSPRFIGYKKWLTEILASLIKKAPPLALVAGKFFSIIKHLLLTTKSKFLK